MRFFSVFEEKTIDPVPEKWTQLLKDAGDWAAKAGRPPTERAIAEYINARWETDTKPLAEPTLDRDRAGQLLNSMRYLNRRCFTSCALVVFMKYWSILKSKNAANLGQHAGREWFLAIEINVLN